MTYWIEKTFSYGAMWDQDQDNVVKLMMHLASGGGDSYRRTIMVIDKSAATKDRETDRVVIGLPDEVLSAAFPGWKPLQGELPSTATLLVGDQLEFEKYFKFPVLGSA